MVDIDKASTSAYEIARIVGAAYEPSAKVGLQVSNGRAAAYSTVTDLARFRG